ncbi:hypothetical protein [Sphingobium aromaticiconvertens]|uniref:hypothetical protein n=1 Tax=Sphingobium aromaticiconvertens TaxID=365341 RepID=UPI00301760AC
MQIMLVLGGLALLALWPPASGRMLLVPLTATAQQSLVVAAVEGGARLIARGPVRRSMIVSGQRGQLMASLARHGIVAMVAPSGGCGS